jgi:hypothetical protein
MGEARGEEMNALVDWIGLVDCLKAICSASIHLQVPQNPHHMYTTNFLYMANRICRR